MASRMCSWTALQSAAISGWSALLQLQSEKALFGWPKLDCVLGFQFGLLENPIQSQIRISTSFCLWQKLILILFVTKGRSLIESASLKSIGKLVALCF